jgi:predicted RNase H-like HicB family nuclease
MNKETELMNELEEFDAVVVNTPYPAALAPRLSEATSAAANEPWGVVVPDLPGCKASGATQEEAMANAIDSVERWIARARAETREVAPPSLMDSLARLPEYAGWTFFFVGTAGLTEVDHERVAEALAEVPEPELSVAADPMPIVEPDKA